jgi:hypothetical protein
MLSFMHLTFWGKKKLQMEFFPHNVIINVLVYILKFFEINLMNEKYPKTF